jgi:hypothetical protein
MIFKFYLVNLYLWNAAQPIRKLDTLLASVDDVRKEHDFDRVLAVGDLLDAFQKVLERKLVRYDRVHLGSMLWNIFGRKKCQKRQFRLKIQQFKIQQFIQKITSTFSRKPPIFLRQKVVKSKLPKTILVSSVTNTQLKLPNYKVQIFVKLQL